MVVLVSFVSEAFDTTDLHVTGMKWYYHSLKEQMQHYDRQPDALNVFFAIQPTPEKSPLPAGRQIAYKSLRANSEERGNA
jgi:hypothetical protein